MSFKSRGKREQQQQQQQQKNIYRLTAFLLASETLLLLKYNLNSFFSHL